MGEFMKSISFKIFMSFFISFLFSCQVYSQNVWFKRILITNDNGIDDIKLIELAKAFSQITETYIVAPSENKSGSTTYLGAVNKGIVETEKRNIGNGIVAYAVKGYPADCVALALTGIMRDKFPDLVISGINGGPNLGKDWLGSGTIGAARFAAFAGIPAIAVSGLNTDIPGSLEYAISWLVNFAKSDIVRNLKAPNYLTVGIPRIAPDKIIGVRIADRAGFIEYPIFEKIPSSKNNGGKEIWKFAGRDTSKIKPPDSSDIALYQKGIIVISPMIAKEIDYKLLEYLKKVQN